ncbi:MAG TPA: methyltransferase domain-containing protein [Polyangia bacterium]|jgi:SAM-dependent methyltransferase|nr:methyltransferase domain-containing protein [Polyangia bacterium]
MLTAEQRSRTLERFQQHRAAWLTNAPLRALYGQWYRRVAAALPPPELGPWLELGSGPGFAREFIPELLLSDLVVAPWHDREASAEALPAADGDLGALVLFDVLHHVRSPRRFFEEACRALRPGGRVILCEPYISPLSYPVYKLVHEEPVDLFVDPLALDPLTARAMAAAPEKDPFDSNQAIPTVLFGRRRSAFESAFPALEIRGVEYLAGPSYPASGGFSRGPVLPFAAWKVLHAVESRLPPALFRLIGFRMLVVLQRR